MKRISIHDGIVKSLKDKLDLDPRFENCTTHIVYSRFGLCGEIDLLAKKDDYWWFFEIKCKDRSRAFRKATAQYQRFKKAYPNLRTRGIYVTPTGIRRLR